MQHRLLSPPASPKAAIASRRNPCYGFCVITELAEEYQANLIALLNKTRNAIVKIVDPIRTDAIHNVKSPTYIKQKFFHAAVFGHQPLLDKESFIKMYANEQTGLLTKNRMNKICDTLQTHLQFDAPFLTPVACELMPDGTVLARFKYQSNNTADATPLLSLVNQLDPDKEFVKWDANNSARYTTVAMAICVIDTNALNAEQLTAIKQQLATASTELSALGAAAIDKYYLIESFDKRTFSLKHISMYACVTKQQINAVKSLKSV